MSSHAVKCAGCGRDLTAEVEINTKLSCPDCGSMKKIRFLTTEDTLVVYSNESSKVKDPIGFVKNEGRTRRQI